MLLKLLLVVVAAMVAVMVIAATRPSIFHIEKSVMIQAPPEKVYALIGDFHNWPEWAAQDREDPTMQRTYSGTVSGLGAVSDWTSKGNAGAGRMMITAATVPSKVDVAVDWNRPFKVRNTHEFTLTPTGDETQVTWTAEGTNLYIMKVMEVFVGVNGLIGRHFEAGLQNLKKVVER